METSNAISQSKSSTKVTLDRIYRNDYQKAGTLTAQIRQVIKTISLYPTKKVASDMQTNVFGASDFGFKPQPFESIETRVAWILVPLGITEAEVQAKLEAANANGACIYRVLSNAPILDENQKYGISAGLVTGGIDHFANNQAVRYGVGNEREGQLTKDKNGNVQYRRTFFWNSPMEDVDVRGNGDIYLSAELKAELNGASAMIGQTL